MRSLQRHAVAFLYATGLGLSIFCARHFWWASGSTTPLNSEGDGDKRIVLEPLFEGLGGHSFKISTRSPLAQRYFDQGLAFYYAFDHEEAFWSFCSALQSDPQCAMALWGMALSHGPHINDMNVNSVHSQLAVAALDHARELSRNGSGVEKALIDALRTRYEFPPPLNRHRLESAYAEAMRSLWHRFPGNADVGALTAEALINLRPWDQWTQDGKPQPGTEELIGLLKAVLAKCPKHIMALHLLIHATEASPHPEASAFAADQLRDAVPTIEHLQHMPSHLYIRIGRWNDAELATERALKADKTFHEQLRRPCAAVTLNTVHDYNMMLYATVMQGKSGKARKVAHDMIDAASLIENAVDQENAMDQEMVGKLDIYAAIPFENHLRFGRWDEMLDERQPKECYPVATALWHFGRGIAFAAKGLTKAALAEQRLFRQCVARVPANAMWMLNVASKVLDVANRMLNGEILFRQGKVDEAVSALKDGVRLEDQLTYTDPPSWIMHVRHALGAVFMDLGRYGEAEAIYREDLRRHAENGWSLYGLARCLEREGKKSEAAVVAGRFEKAWQHADHKMSSSCCCVPLVDGELSDGLLGRSILRAHGH